MEISKDIAGLFLTKNLFNSS